MSSADELLAELGNRLANDVSDVLPLWVEASVERVYVAWSGALPADVRVEAKLAGQVAVEEVMPSLRELVSADVDDQWTNPLHMLRLAVRYPTRVLRDAGVPEVVREEFQETYAPDDVYGLEPAGFDDVGPALREVGLAWGAAKARAHLVRHRKSPS